MLSICYSVKNRTNLKTKHGEISLLPKSIKSVEDAMKGIGVPYEIIVADWQSRDTDYAWFDVSSKSDLKRNKLVSINSNQVFQDFSDDFYYSDTAFSRGYGLNMAAKVSRYKHLLFLDADMLVTQDFLVRCLSATIKDNIYFPICWYLTEEDRHMAQECLGNEDLPDTMYESKREKEEDDFPETSGWQIGGMGICAITNDTWSSVHGWPEYAGWGGEDLHFADGLRLKGHHSKFVRQNDVGLVHQWHPIHRGIRALPIQEKIREAQIHNYIKLNGWDKVGDK